MAAGTLYLIPCPIADDTMPYAVTPESNRAIIDSLDYFIVENIRSARRFLSKAGVSRPIDELEFVELDEHTVADPGQPVVELCHKRGIRVVPLVGPSSIIMAVMASGLNGQSFAFNGYLPVKEPDRSRAIRRFEARAVAERQSQAFIEAPYRNVKLAEQILRTCAAETRLCIACDITSASEFIRTATVGEWRRSGIPDIQKRPTIFVIGR